MGAAYSFLSRWSLDVPARRCWEEIERMLRADAAAPTWWPGVELVTPPSRLAAGEHLVLAVRSPLGYRLRVRLELVHVDPGRALSAASTGDLRGSGRVEVAAAGPESSIVTFRWDVATERRWMNATAWALRPAFERAHAHVMRAGERGLRAELEQGQG
ncbi:hypothetical protein [Microbacterium sp. 2FI]|uniref:hypothetical protein n=1 Tax=Microbacterium sp. 2FI TaxID=2502193 RepID=UPI0010F48680|nr:hypothetical protein [Microbacterium sp. 2FI]